MRLHAAAGEAPRSGAGLVPSINNVETGPWVDRALSTLVRTPKWQLERDSLLELLKARQADCPLQDVSESPWLPSADSIKVDHVVARCTRLRKNLGVAAKWLSKGAGQAYMLTFTYRDDDDWRPSHVREAIAHLRKWLRRAYGWTLRYIWVMEPMDRKSGTRVGDVIPHYHCIVWVPRELVASDLFLDRRGWWSHGFTNAVLAVAPVRYVMKYVGKFDKGNAFPKGARCYGVGGLDVVGRRCRRWINWPAFVQARADVATEVRRVVGGGWSVAGAFFASEWGLSAIGRGYTRLVRLCTHPPTGIEPVGPFSFLAGAGLSA